VDAGFLSSQSFCIYLEERHILSDNSQVDPQEWTAVLTHSQVYDSQARVEAEVELVCWQDEEYTLCALAAWRWNCSLPQVTV